MNKLILIGVVLAFSGCATTAGPFVTNVTQNQDGSLTIDRCMVKFDPWSSAVNQGECQHFTQGGRTPSNEKN